MMKFKYFNIFFLILFSFSCAKKDKNSKNVSTTSKPNLEKFEKNAIILRMTNSKDQKDSEFCWVFSSIAILESIYLEKNPKVNSDSINLSEWYFKESNGSDKYQGTMIAALNSYSKEIGIVSANDYKRSDNGKVFETTFLGEVMSPLELRDKLVGSLKFWSYAISPFISGWSAHPDPTALEGEEAYFVPRSSINNIIRKSLKLRAAIGYWFDSHVVVIYGAKYDTNGKALKYYIKDSYPPYFYERDADFVHTKIITLTGISNLDS